MKQDVTIMGNTVGVLCPGRTEVISAPSIFPKLLECNFKKATYLNVIFRRNMQVHQELQMY